MDIGGDVVVIRCEQVQSSVTVVFFGGTTASLDLELGLGERSAEALPNTFLSQPDMTAMGLLLQAHLGQWIVL